MEILVFNFIQNAFCAGISKTSRYKINNYKKEKNIFKTKNNYYKSQNKSFMIVVQKHKTWN